MPPPLSKNQIIEDLFVSKNFNDAINKMEPAHLRDDLKMEVISIVCGWDDEKVIKLYQDNALEFYTVRVILNQAKSNRSPFAKRYRTPVVEITKEVRSEPDEIEDRFIKEMAEDLAVEELNKLYWYDAEMIRLYLKLGSFRAIQEHTGIPFISCYKNIKKSLAVLQKKDFRKAAERIFTKEELRFIQNNKPCRDI